MADAPAARCYADCMPVVSSLFIYPIKGCAGISLKEVAFDRRGPRLDRKWMLVDSKGKAITQRTNSLLAWIRTELTPKGICAISPDGARLVLPNEEGGTPRRVSVWNFTGEANDLGDVAADWFSDVLDERCRLVRFKNGTKRAVKKTKRAEVAFADEYPFLLVSVESLVDLNDRLDPPVAMNRFRPNVVVRECPPFDEDQWSRVQAPQLEFSVVKPCKRCKVTTINQRTLEQSKEPLLTLAKFRKTKAGVIFGQNCIHHSNGSLRVGDTLAVSYKSS